ncbi:hypothetical protein [Hydrogenophaga sp.]|uniref:hypothetical protein n=1 Tax=Hydrogenophaga sp. TaxID=1904254 RepID=UPI00262BED34|nr:hypothetical protein [Hydrogenophaga sp.]
MPDQILHIDAKPDIHTLMEMVKAVLNIPADTPDPIESAHIEKAGELVRKIGPDVILLNIHAPGLDNREVFERAEKNLSLRGIVHMLALARGKGLKPTPTPTPTTREGCVTYISQKANKIQRP